MRMIDAMISTPCCACWGTGFVSVGASSQGYEVCRLCGGMASTFARDVRNVAVVVPENATDA